MKYLILTVVFIAFILSCNNSKREDDYFVIKSISELQKQDSTIIAPAFFYGHHNFILTDKNRLFYHDNYYRYSMCGTGIDFSKPPRLYITPDSLIEIKNLSEFLKQNISSVNPNHKEQILVSISSENDTIKNSNLKLLRDFYKDKKKFLTNIRMWTEEEQYVTESKINNKEYDRRNIKWKIGFDQNPEELIEFLPPVADK